MTRALRLVALVVTIAACGGAEPRPSSAAAGASAGDAESAIRHTLARLAEALPGCTPEGWQPSVGREGNTLHGGLSCLRGGHLVRPDPAEPTKRSMQVAWDAPDGYEVAVELFTGDFERLMQAQYPPGSFPSRRSGVRARVHVDGAAVDVRERIAETVRRVLDDELGRAPPP